MKKTLIAFFAALLVGGLAGAASETPRLQTFNGGVYNEPLITYSSKSALISRSQTGYGDLQACPGTGLTSETPVGALQFVPDAGYVQCMAAGWEVIGSNTNATITGTNATLTGTLKVAVIDAGVLLVNGPGQVTGPLLGQYVATTGAAGSATGTGSALIGSLTSTTTGGLWLGVAPASVTGTNYAIRGDTTDVYMRAANNVYTVINGSIIGSWSATGLDVTGKISSTNGTTCTLNAASPSVCTATVTAGAKCSCTNVGASAAIAANGCAVGLSSTTLTVTSANGANNVVNILCDK